MKNLLFTIWIGIELLVAAFTSNAADFPPPEQVFKYSAQVSGDQLVVTWTIQKGYYLYRKRLGFESATPGISFGTPLWPKGVTHTDDYFGPQEIYRGSVDFRIPLTFAGPRPETLVVKLKLQGCADAGLCYPPSTWSTRVKLPAATASPGGDELAALIKSSQKPRGDDFLPADEAFQFTVRRADAHTIAIDWKIAQGYYLYKDRIAITPQGDARFGTAVLPAAEPKHDEFLGKTEVYHSNLEARVPLIAGNWPITARVTYQGCAEAGLCYNPVTKTVTITATP